MERVVSENVDVDHVAINKISQKLASNDVHLRNYTLKKLRRLLERSANANDGLICEINLLRLWKGLHYCMWMADKPLFQEELAERLSAFVGAFKNPEQSLLFVSSFLKIEAQEWHLLDFFRLDKFMMLVRKVIIQSLKLLQTLDWDSSLTQKFVTTVDDTLKIDSAPGFVTHLLNVIRDELKHLLEGRFLEEDERIQQFSQLFTKRNRKLVEQLAKKKKKILSAAECKKAVKETLTEKDIEEAADRMLQFEYENVINLERGNKKRERKRKRESDEDSDAQLDESNDSQEESSAIDRPDFDDNDSEEDDIDEDDLGGDDRDEDDLDEDDTDGDDLGGDESSVDSLSDAEPTPKKSKNMSNSKGKAKPVKASAEKKFQKKKRSKPMRVKSSDKKKQNKKTGKRPKA